MKYRHRALQRRWTRWFAWRPVETDDTDSIVWLERVWWRWEHYAGPEYRVAYREKLPFAEHDCLQGVDGTPGRTPRCGICGEYIIKYYVREEGT